MNSLVTRSLKVEKLASDGRGIAYWGRKVTFIPNSVPGDLVHVRMTKEGKDYDEAVIDHIITPSPDRHQPKCIYYEACGGCHLQHMTYQAQLVWKKQIVLDALRRVGRFSVAEIADVIPSSRQWNYRSRVQLHRDSRGQIGFYRPRSHQVVALDHCVIADERINEHIKALTREENISPLHDETIILEAKQGRVDHSTLSFEQANENQNERLKSLVAEYLSLSSQDRVVDLYSGAGNFALMLADKVRHVWAVEKDDMAVEKGKKLACGRGIRNLDWINQSALRGLMQLHKEGQEPNKIVMDPPRRGAAEALPLVLKFRPEALVYVSCNPATFARDTAEILESGYILKKCQPIDMFPQTAHVEIIGLYGTS